MIICLCHRVSDRDIAREAADGCEGFDAFQERTRAGTACGVCVPMAQQLFAAQCEGCGRCRATAADVSGPPPAWALGPAGA
ncbi:MAG: (2Fe-2S)-binding protein [Rubrivivax sp.]|nr:(2Fe-2S)-binding protein [Rubrivivax sp.]